MPKAAKKTKAPARPDGRRPLTTYMFPETIKDLKMAALEEDKNAYEIVEEAVKNWLAIRNKRRRVKP